ncbi:Disease resistance protein RGA2 [Zea mays]|uniref:Disease resistance protein RGA2 n=1 Tax=Zea mays TaxID=4577 RepID=A0A1D6PNC4_MAIZE|nr:Disease resistance protein RGA2 [Zea mays]
MAKTSEVIAGIALGIPLMNGVLVPIITILVNRFFSILLTDTSRKLSNLENLTIPSLKETLVQVEEQRMVRAPKDAQSESDLRTLDGLTTELKAALYEAEEILDLVDYYRIKKRIADDAEENGRSRWVQQTLRAFRTSMARCQGSSWVRHLHDCVGLCVACCKGTLFRRSGEQLPISHASSVSMAQRLRGWYRHLVHHIPSSSRSVMQWLRHWFQHLVFNFAKLCESGTQTLPGLPAADVIATNQDWSYKVIGINSNQNDGTATASFLLTIARHNLTKRIEHIENVLNDLKKSHLLNQQSTISSSSNKEKSSRHEDIQYLYRSIERKVIGRDKEREKLIRSGKSTLAQYVCDYEKAEGQHFDPVMFIHVSQTFRVDKIFRDMLREIRKDRQSDSNSVKCLHDELKEKLRGKCFLLVLDDLWVSRENQEERAILLTVLDAGQSGSRVLVTAQKKDVAAAFIAIGRKIAKKLGRSPIAAVTVAARLRSNSSIDFWETTANLDMLDETMGALWWSYQQLGVDVRRCFAYCSTFPRGYRLVRDELVHIWIAQGFINTRVNATEQPEDIGLHYINELRTFSFLQIERTVFGTETEAFTIHDLLHELAERVSGSECFRVVSNSSPKHIPQEVRHLFVGTGTDSRSAITKKILGLVNLRTLIIVEEYSENKRKTFAAEDAEERSGRALVNEEVLDRMFRSLRKLRALVVTTRQYHERALLVPASIDQMKHLRYLSFNLDCSHRSVELIFPSTFSKLYHMQSIYAEKISCAKDVTQNLTSLRHSSSSSMGFANVGRLTSLQSLRYFQVKREQGHELKQLKHLNNLRGTLAIDGLGIVRSKEEALEAHLASKERLRKLELSFSVRQAGDPNAVAEILNRLLPPEDPTNHRYHGWMMGGQTPDVAAEVLEGLCPPKDLAALTINRYKGSRYPSWMLSSQSPGALKYLQELELHNCNRLASFPEEGTELFSCLRELRVSFCDWDSMPENMELLVSLQSVLIMRCDRMERLPTLPPSLAKVEIHGCRVLSRTCQAEGHENWRKILHIPEKNISPRRSMAQ